MQVRPGDVAGGSDERHGLALRDRLADADEDRRRVCVRGREAVAVVDDDEVAVSAEPAGIDDRAGGGGAIRSAVRTSDVDALVHPPPAHPEAADDHPVARPDEPCGRWLAGAAGARSFLRRLDLRSERRALARRAPRPRRGTPRESLACSRARSASATRRSTSGRGLPRGGHGQRAPRRCGQR